MMIDPDKKIKLSIEVSGIAASEMEVQQFAASVQHNLSYSLGVTPENLEVEVEVADGAEETPEEPEADEDMSAEDITAMTPEKFKASKGKIMSKMGAK